MKTAAAQAMFDLSQANGNGMKDPASAENRNYPVHRWVPWVAGFSRNFVDSILLHYLPEVSGPIPLVLDPFCGVGTTLVEAMRRGYNGVGFEINPYAALASRAKIRSFRIDREALYQSIQDYETEMADVTRELVAGNLSRLAKLKGQIPKGFKSRIPFFSEAVLWRVLATLEFASQLKIEDINNMFRVALGSVMVRFSNYSYEPSLGTRPASGKTLITEAPVDQIMASKLRDMLEDVETVQRDFRRLLVPPQGRVCEDSFFNARQYFVSDSVDIVITSPPYLNNYHYVRNTRPQLWWLGLVQEQRDLRLVEENNVGKYWQTVRNSETVRLSVPVPAIQHLLEEISHKNPGRGIYGGTGWANYVATYFNDLARFAWLLNVLLKPGCHAVVVLGNSVIQGEEVKVDRFLSEIAALYHLDTVSSDIIRRRVGSSIVGSGLRADKETCTAPLYDAAVVLRKPH